MRNLPSRLAPSSQPLGTSSSLSMLERMLGSSLSFLSISSVDFGRAAAHPCPEPMARSRGMSRAKTKSIFPKVITVTPRPKISRHGTNIGPQPAGMRQVAARKLRRSFLPRVTTNDGTRIPKGLVAMNTGLEHIGFFPVHPFLPLLPSSRPPYHGSLFNAILGAQRIGGLLVHAGVDVAVEDFKLEA